MWRLFRKRTKFAPPRPDRPLAVIGDVHGQAELLARLLDRLDPAGRDIVQVGDLIDRGDNSAGVLADLSRRPEVTCLMGNHEAMCLDFLDAPDVFGEMWLRNGGRQTLDSFGVGPIGEVHPDAMWAARDALADAMGAGLIDWLRARPLWWQSGTVGVAHAGADPDRPLAGQDVKNLAWGHARFLSKPRRDGLWMVHGHWIVETPTARDGRISVDTGAYATGRLTAALIDDGDVRFLSVEDD